MSTQTEPAGKRGGSADAPLTRGGRERRAAERVGLRLPVAYREVPARPPLSRHGQTLDVSRSGMRFRSEEFIAVGTFLALELGLAGRPAFTARGRTVWTRQGRGDGHWEIGAEFLRSGGDADAALAEALVLAM